MSVIFDAMLIFEIPDRKGVADLNRLLREKDTERQQQFNEIDMGGAGGTKFFCTSVYAAAFNHLIPDDVEDCIRAASWRFPATVLYVCDLGDYFYDEEQSLSARTVEQLRQGLGG